MKKKWLKALPWIVLAAAYLFSVAFWGLYGSHNLISDDSAELLLARQLNEEGGIISENWYYSTELRLASPVQVYQLTLRIFPENWQAARTLAAALIMAAVAGCAVYAAYGLGLRKSAPWIATVLVLPFSGAYSWLVIYQCHYCVHIGLALLMLGMIARSGRASGRRRVLLCVALTAAALVGGLNGVRILTMFIVPVFAAVVLMAALACKAHATFREAAGEPEVRMLVPTLLATAAAGAGYVINMKVLSGRYAYYNYGLENLKKFSAADFLHQIDGLVDMFGYYQGASFFSLKGIASFVGFGIVILLLLAVLRMLTRWKHLSAPLRLLTMTTVTAVALGMTLNVLLGQTLARYFLLGILLMMITLAAAVETEPCKNGALRGLAGAAVMACFLFQTGCGVLYGYRQGDVNYEMAADWLMEHGYTQGYATYWNAFPLEEASDGRITMRALHPGDWQNLTLFTMNQSKTRIAGEPEGPVFLLVDEIESAVDCPLLDEAHLADENLIAWSYYVYVYDSVDEMRALLAQ